MPIAFVKGSNIQYEQFYQEEEDNKGQKPKHVLFLHGIGISSTAWKDIPEALSKIVTSRNEHIHTINIDLLGFGKSDKPLTANYTIKGYSEFISDLLLEEEIGVKKEEKITIVGHSLGGYIAAEFAIRNKNRIESLVLIDSSGTLEQPTPLLSQYLTVAMDLEPNRDRVRDVFKQMYANPAFLSDILVDYFIGLMRDQGAKKAFRTAFDDSTSRPIGLKRLETIVDIPCLLIRGDQDNVIPEKSSEDFKKALVKAKYEIVKNAGHAPFAEKTSVVFEKIRSFLT
jgi:pimeloyl-ACP methyl ester carboxylesterase